MDDLEIISETDLPHCHYCGRFAFEFYYEGIHVCENCLNDLSKGRTWRLVKNSVGEYWVTCADDYSEFEVLGNGTFKEMWELCQRYDD